MKIDCITPKNFTIYRKNSLKTHFKTYSKEYANDTVTFGNKRRKAAGIAAALMVLAALGTEGKAPEIQNQDVFEPQPKTETKIPDEKLTVHPIEESVYVETDSEEDEDIIELPTITKGENAVEIAKLFIGFNEEETEEVCGYDLPDGQWCAAFVKYILDTAYGDELPNWYTEDGYNKCSDVLYYASKNDAVFYDYNLAKAGDIVIFNINGKKAAHMGLVVSVEDNILTTIEGNTGDGVVISKTYDLIETPEKINSFVKVAEE